MLHVYPPRFQPIFDSIIGSVHKGAKSKYINIYHRLWSKGCEEEPCYVANGWRLISPGPKVVSKDITVESIEEVSKILRRAPVIWDNIHANDYDQKRLFLGPYKGRSTELIPRLKGVLTNPNCEFESNFVAIHTLATWYKSNMNGVRKDVVMSK